MKGLVFRSFGVSALCILSLGLASCGNDQRIVSIVVTPQNISIGGVGCSTAPCGPTVQYKAVGFYNHGGGAKDGPRQGGCFTRGPGNLSCRSRPPRFLAPPG